MVPFKYFSKPFVIVILYLSFIVAAILFFSLKETDTLHTENECSINDCIQLLQLEDKYHQQ
ncbi:hypothetical protein QA601_01190 [Chitinispirillales bacterium ANBcel5]|uniref:hypothetical protein n=1 Tax=Cellulosispirillum alkaliphilum TaxID=3039283 RepID=UPI002A561E92|nr:hypothetical protein [Chitinispirillales bacterium ANBcel5]